MALTSVKIKLKTRGTKKNQLGGVCRKNALGHREWDKQCQKRLRGK